MYLITTLYISYFFIFKKCNDDTRKRVGTTWYRYQVPHHWSQFAIRLTSNLALPIGDRRVAISSFS